MTLSLLRVTFFSLFFLLVSIGFSQDYYVVIGSFADEQATKRFTGYARSLHYDAQYIRNESSKLFHVYVLKTQDRKTASALTVRLQGETEFADAWMYYGTQNQPAEVTMQREPEINVPVETPEKEALEGPPVISEEITLQDEAGKKPVVRGKLFNFKVTTSEGQEVPGMVYNVDRLQGRDLAAYNANTIADVLKPSIAGTPITIVCEIFGFSEEVKIIDYANPELTEGAYLDEEGIWVIPFTLTRLKKGDISILYNVSFYKDAVIMLPNSSEDMDELVSMMRLNPNYAIKVHSHNNGNEKNLRIITLGNDKNYFSMGRSLSKNGSAKELTQLRAETIKSYLIDHGIAKDRITTQGWGGLAMMLKPGTTAATRLNNRIEIEILQD